MPKVLVDEAQALVLARGQRMEWTALDGGRNLAGAVCAVLNAESGPSLVAVVAANPDGTVKILRGFGR